MTKIIVVVGVLWYYNIQQAVGAYNIILHVQGDYVIGENWILFKNNRGPKSMAQHVGVKFSQTFRLPKSKL